MVAGHTQCFGYNSWKKSLAYFLPSIHLSRHWTNAAAVRQLDYWILEWYLIDFFVFAHRIKCEGNWLCLLSFCIHTHKNFMIKYVVCFASDQTVITPLRGARWLIGSMSGASALPLPWWAGCRHSIESFLTCVYARCANQRKSFALLFIEHTLTTEATKVRIARFSSHCMYGMCVDWYMSTFSQLFDV